MAEADYNHISSHTLPLEKHKRLLIFLFDKIFNQKYFNISAQLFSYQPLIEALMRRHICQASYCIMLSTRDTKISVTLLRDKYSSKEGGNICL